MDGVSLAASILTLASVFPLSVKAVNNFITAPDDLRDLVNQMHHLESVVTRDIEIVQTQECQQNILETLHALHDKVLTVQTTFGIRFNVARHPTTTPKFKRSSWLRRVHEVKKIKKDIAIIKEELHITTNTLILSSLGDVLHKFRHNSSPVVTAGLPNWSLERSRRFYPESCIIEKPWQQQLLVCSMHEVQQTATARVDKYYLLCPIDARHWRRVTVFATKPITQYQSLVSSPRTNTAYRSLPGIVQPRLEKFLRCKGIDSYRSVMQVHIRLEMDAVENVSFTSEHATYHEDMEEAVNADTSRYVDEIKCRGLPVYLESDVITLTREADFFSVLVGAQVYVECKLPFSQRTPLDRHPVEDFVANMNLLLAAQGCEGIPKFSGFVVDDNCAQLQSYLLEAPICGRLWTMMATAKEMEVPISWTRRERWFRQLVVMTAEIHGRGLIAGYHAWSFYQFFIDSKDDLKLITLSSRHVGVGNHRGFLAPELRSRMDSGAVAQSYRVTVKIDMFSLGMILWQLVHYSKAGNHIFCPNSGCEVLPRYKCTAEHTNPISLPVGANLGVPSYVKTIIDHCRQEDPSKRLPALELLKLLPADADSERVPDTVQSTPFWQDRTLPAMNPTCDNCGNTTSRDHYHCNVCAEGDFDLCPSCYADETRCYDDRHVMLRRVHQDGALVNIPLSSKS